MRTVALIAIATVCFAASEPVVSLNSLKEVEASINDKLRSSITDPYDLLGPARGTYLPGYGALFTVEANLVLMSPLNVSPFKPSISEQEVKSVHDRKVRRVVELKETMRGLMMNASKQLPGLPPSERIVMEAFLFNYRWENARQLPRRVKLIGEKQKLLDAANRHASPADIAALIQEEEL